MRSRLQKDRLTSLRNSLLAASLTALLFPLGTSPAWSAPKPAAKKAAAAPAKKAAPASNAVAPTHSPAPAAAPASVKQVK